MHDFPSQPPDPFQGYSANYSAGGQVHPAGHPQRSNAWIWVLGIVGALLGLPLCCCAGMLTYSMFNTGQQAVLSNARATPGFLSFVQVDYTLEGGPDRRRRYFLVVETATGERNEWLFTGLAERGTLDVQFASIAFGQSSTRPWKVYIEADGAAMSRRRISNIVEIP